MEARDYRRIARERMSENRILSILASLVATLLGGGISGAANMNSSWNISERMIDAHPMLAQILALVASVGGILAIAQLIIGGTVQLGYCSFLMKQQRRESFALNDIFSCFDQFSRGFVQALLRGIYILLWSLLFIIPGFVKTYSYAMTPFIMAENPDISPNEAITASRELMDGHKMDLFLLDLSFIGWNLLSLLTLGILNLWVMPYHNAAYAAFYRDITKN